MQNFAGLALERVSAEVLVFLLHLAEARQDRIHGIGFLVGHRMLQGLQFVMEITDASTAGYGLIEHGTPRHLFDILAEIAYREAFGHGHLALILMFFADNHAKESRLAGAIGPNEPNLLSRVELERRVHEENLTAVLLTDAGKRDHTNSLA